MAQKISITLVSDLSGEAIEDGAGSTIQFGFQGRNYEIDLSDIEAKDFEESLESYINVARRSSSKTRSTAPAVASTSGSGHSKQELASIKTWAAENGFVVNSRGRLKSEILEAYKNAH